MNIFKPLVALTLLAISTGCMISGEPRFMQAAEGSFQRSLATAGATQLDVETGSGKIAITRGSDSKVEIHATVRVGDNWRRSRSEAESLVREITANPPISQSGDTIRVGHLEDSRFQNNVSISYEITVPEQTSIKSSTGSGEQNIAGVTGPVEVHTGSGRLILSNIRNSVRAGTGSGSIRADRVSDFSGNTGSGSITITQSASGNVEASTGSGSIEVGGIKGALRATTGSGRINVEGEQTGGWSLSTSSGSITIRLPSNAGFDLDAHTSSGQIYVDHPLTVQGRIGNRRHDVNGKVRGGGYSLNVRTSSGSIRIE